MQNSKHPKLIRSDHVENPVRKAHEIDSPHISKPDGEPRRLIAHQSVRLTKAIKKLGAKARLVSSYHKKAALKSALTRRCLLTVSMGNLLNHLIEVSLFKALEFIW